MHCTKTSPNSNAKVKGRRSNSLGAKNAKVRHFVRESSSGALSSCVIFREQSSGARSTTQVGKSAHAV